MSSVEWCPVRRGLNVFNLASAGRVFICTRPELFITVPRYPSTGRRQVINRNNTEWNFEYIYFPSFTGYQRFPISLMDWLTSIKMADRDLEKSLGTSITELFAKFVTDVFVLIGPKRVVM